MHKRRTIAFLVCLLVAAAFYGWARFYKGEEGSALTVAFGIAIIIVLGAAHHFSPLVKSDSEDEEELL